MFKILKRTHERFFGIGEADTSVPVFDGALKPNNRLETAAVLLERTGLDDMAVDAEGRLVLACGTEVLALDAGGTVSVLTRLGAPVQALVAFRDSLAVATSEGVTFVGGALNGREVLAPESGKPLRHVNALCERAGGTLLITEGSRTQPPADWAADLLTHGRTGRVLEHVPDTGECRIRAQGLAYAYGVCDSGHGVLVSESWKHRVRVLDGDGARTGPSEIPGYPSRIVPASGGGFWLTVFAPRTQLLEFVLREDAFREEMMRTIEPRYWVAPALSSGADFLEPLQQGSVRQMGILKPWAPPRSYGLVLRLAPDLSPLYSLHSRVGGRHHGITAALEYQGNLLALSKGSGRIVRIPLPELEQQD